MSETEPWILQPHQGRHDLTSDLHESSMYRWVPAKADESSAVEPASQLPEHLPRKRGLANAAGANNGHNPEVPDNLALRAVETDEATRLLVAPRLVAAFVVT